ncbi:DUF4873 domain-containing protein [Gordonia sp. CPCC 206044]|uniref:DUF4873 domain-containing protein n=1 Tax=Gordonia sp. CPCC 206044 TaxID=3140793 RepID=UPI003AF3DF5B
MTTVAIRGTGPLANALRDRLERSPLSITMVEREPANLVVREGAAPPDSHLGLTSADEPGVFYLDDPLAVGYLVALAEHHEVSGASTVTVRRPIQIEWARRGSQRLRRRRLRRFDPVDYDWGGPESLDDDVFDGTVRLDSDDGDEVTARVRLVGRVDPLDGRYHWGGTVFGADVRSWKESRVGRVTVSAHGREPVDARLSEITPSGDVHIVGVGQPPYELDPLVVDARSTDPAQVIV